VLASQRALTVVDPQVEADLDLMLSEPIASAEHRARSLGELRGGPIVLYGAGNLGQTVLERLRRQHVEPVAFADDTPGKQGQVINSLLVITPEEAVGRYGDEATFVVTVLNPLASYLVLERRLRAITTARIVSFLQLAWVYAGEFLPYYEFELPQHLLRKAPEIKRAFQLFTDDEARRQYVAHLRFRLHLDYAALPASSDGDYFPVDVVGQLSPNITFVDCGAYDGDTIRRFLRQQHGAFERIHAFEPDETTCRRLRAYVESLGTGVASRIHVLQAAVGSRRQSARFISTGGTGSAIGGAGDSEVDVVALQDVIQDEEAPLYIKFDVEGAESEALAGAERLIRRSRPILAVSVYHRPNDLWEIPAYLHSLDLGYNLSLRTQGEDGLDVVCYAVPPRPNHA
jgi:FkbM family methyltransferase